MTDPGGPGIWHLFRDGEPYTLIVYGPDQAGSWDVEIHEEHVDQGSRSPATFLGSSSLKRSSHIVQDMWDAVADAMYQRRCEREDFERDPRGEPPPWMKWSFDQLGSEMR